MIKINKKEENIIEKEISFGNFEVNDGKSIRKGISPILSFVTDQSKTIEIETTLSSEILEKVNNHALTNINKYITDINYEDQNGWLSLMTGEYKVDLVKDNETCRLLLFVEDKAEQIKIELDEIIEFDRK
ncbi:MAG: hypothetical protein IJ193_09360 [Bacilli bacterium]|nr:hypothetical protein [Bacilli bacterium]